ncbi:hypothetical protein QBC36DRAFT_194111 [Triangularia setosa]|uniref:Uncharacterized protein n=1 Tax=Triangularia setosa TaxID=2587417 RepID=A0AAN6W2B7_9PEZI|nr:hypothetical protein QBC36DRAFT_194111 [Podospora setosa]
MGEPNLPSAEAGRLYLACAEDIACISLISPSPGIRQDNSPNYVVSRPDSTRVLTLDAEAALTSTLAFLSGISDDRNHVIALVVEESLPQGEIRVVTAINKDCPESNDGILTEIKDGLQEILGGLSVAGNEPSNDLKSRILTAILVVCKRRLFSRIGVERDGVRNAKNMTFMASCTQNVINGVKRRHTADTKAFIKGAKHLVSLLNRLKNCRSSDLIETLRNIVWECSQLRKGTNFEKLFSGVTGAELDPGIRTSFVNRVAKIARYYESSHYLVELSERSGLFKRTEVVTVSLDASSFRRYQTMSSDSGLQTCLQRCHGSKPSPLDARTISRRIKKGPDQANAEFKKSVKMILDDSKIHAEVQLVAYYELFPSIKRPRVICSSKDACYLCNLFIQTHGMFHTPKTHGNLYTGWRIPPILALNGVHDQFDRTLQGQIRDTVLEYWKDPERTPRITRNENESTILPLAALISSLEGITPLAVEPPQAGPVQKPRKQRRRPPKQPLEQPPELPSELPQNLLPEQLPATPVIPEPSNWHTPQPSDSQVDSQNERSPGQKPSGKSTPTHPSSPSIPVFSLTSLVSLLAALPSPPILLKSSPKPTESTPTALNTPSISQEISPALANNSCRSIDQLDEPSIMKSYSSRKSTGKKPAAQEPQVNKANKSRVEESRSPPPSHVKGRAPKLTARNLKLFNQSQEFFDEQVETQKLTKSAASQTSTELAERRPRAPNQARSPSYFGRVPGLSGQEGKILLRRGKTTSVRVDGDSLLLPVYTTRKLDIFLERVDDCERRNWLARRGKAVKVNITWLDKKDCMGKRSVWGSNYHCLERLEKGVNVDGRSGEVVYLEQGGEVVVVDVVREGKGKRFGKGVW